VTEGGQFRLSASGSTARCKSAQPVREHLLLVLSGNKYEYRCAVRHASADGTTAATSNEIRGAGW
jgi:hypothetical protein